MRQNSNYLITIGACATAGGLQPLRNLADERQWIAPVYAKPEYIHSLTTATQISKHVKVDMELWGCPVNSRQVVAAVQALLFGVSPIPEHDKVCMECG